MSEPFSHPVALDAKVLSNYASIDSVTWLTTLEQFLPPAVAPAYY